MMLPVPQRRMLYNNASELSSSAPCRRLYGIDYRVDMQYYSAFIHLKMEMALFRYHNSEKNGLTHTHHN